jgi:hypothetical protein
MPDRPRPILGLAMLQQNRFCVAVPGQNRDQFLAAIAAITEDSDGGTNRHG